MPESRAPRAKTARIKPGERRLQGRAAPSGLGNFLIVGIGASAGGLDACRKLFAGIPAHSGMAFILVQHLDPTHESMMVELLTAHTSMSVQQAADGMLIESEHIYVIPPGTYLAIRNGALYLSFPQARHGARLPFDFLLHSLAQECGPRAACVILSGTGADGSLGLKSIKEKCGLVIAQDPADAVYPGMPQSAIATHDVDLILPVAGIPDALITYERHISLARSHNILISKDGAQDWLADIVALLRDKTSHDFTLYKRGTLQRRIERRMAIAAIKTHSMDRYLDILRNNPQELDLLAKDLLINVTSFFRDAHVFDLMAKTVIPDLVQKHAPDRPLRIWVAGCSTGEETYSLVMLFREQIAAAKANVKLQFFASDVDPDAVATAREGCYPETIEADVSPERLARFFVKEDRHYRILPELRGTVIFTVQDILADPPFSRLDMVSCRNLLIYLGPEAQAKVIALFHFALLDGGILLLGNSESVGKTGGRFEFIAKSERIYRHISRSRPGELGLLFNSANAIRGAAAAAHLSLPRPAALGELCRRLVMESYAPAAVLINRKFECLYSVGAVERYLRMAAGHPTHDLISMAHRDIRIRLRSAIEKSYREKVRLRISGGQIEGGRADSRFAIDIHPIAGDDAELMLVCFIDEPTQASKRENAPEDLPRIAELERELEAVRADLHNAVRTLELSGEEQKAINEEALSVNEEYQSTNEELLTSKEELQSLNEELTALNSQLQETLESQRTTSNDLQNILYSTDVATLFLDPHLNIRFFTPATRLLFNVIASDIGRPLEDLHSLAADAALSADCRTVLENLLPLEREIETRGGIWFIRRILPYRTHDNGAGGVVITFTDITERKHAAIALEAAKQQAEQANAAKSHFLAAASHDLRQPLQTLALLQGVLAKNVEGEAAQNLLSRLDQTLGAMSGMLNTLLDMNQIDAGTIQPNLTFVAIGGIFDLLRDEFSYHAQAKGIELRVVSSQIRIVSDARLLEQIIRNLLSNALKYTSRGKILLGCRVRSGQVIVEIWDTGIGIASGELAAIFEEYHQVENPARERSRGLGLGLSIVQRLGKLLGHRVYVRSKLGKGSVFSVEISLPSQEGIPPKPKKPEPHREEQNSARAGTIWIVEDDPELRDLLQNLFNLNGYLTATASDGPSALALADAGAPIPDLILADYNLPGAASGIDVAESLREKIRPDIPVVILTGDISMESLRYIAAKNCLKLNKPVKIKELLDAIQRLLPKTEITPAESSQGKVAAISKRPDIFIVDDDRHIRDGLREILESCGHVVEDSESCEAFLKLDRSGGPACLLLDAYLPGMSGFELLRLLNESGAGLPSIMITGKSDVATAVRAMKAGAIDFIEKPVNHNELISSIDHALELARDWSTASAWQKAATDSIAGLTPRQRQIMDMVLAGQPSKNIANDLGISQRTVENHRNLIMKKTGAKSLAALARLALTASGGFAKKSFKAFPD